MLKLFLPILFPSWRFFSNIGPSPRIYYSILKDESDEPDHWQEFRPKPERIFFKKSLLNLLHDPTGNETLYINTCAECLFEGYSEFREQEIMQRLLNAVNVKEIPVEAEAKYLVYRISAVIREANAVTRQVTFVAKPALITGTAK